MFEKVSSFARDGKGRRLLNALSKRQTGLEPSQVEQVLALYRDFGLDLDVEGLKNRRGILKDCQYDDLAAKVKNNCSYETLDDFIICLKELLTSGIKMNPTKMEENNS